MALKQIVYVQFLPYYPLASAFLSMLAAQFLKSVHCVVVDRKIDIRRWFSSGGMPSSHSAMVCSLSMAVGLQEGFSSALFSMCVVFSLIVLYDAAGVRQMVGKQAIVLNKLIEDTKKGYPIEIKKVKEFLGHTPFEVVMGAILGVSIAYMLWIW